DDLLTARTESEANRGVATSCLRTGNEERRHVRAGDEEEEAGGSPEGQKHRAQTAEDLVPQRDHLEPIPLVRVRILFRGTLGVSVHLLPCRLQGEPRPQTSDRVEVMKSAFVCVGPKAVWNPNVHRS